MFTYNTSLANATSSFVTNLRLSAFSWVSMIAPAGTNRFGLMRTPPVTSALIEIKHPSPIIASKITTLNPIVADFTWSVYNTFVFNHSMFDDTNDCLHAPIISHLFFSERAKKNVPIIRQTVVQMAMAIKFTNGLNKTTLAYSDVPV